MICTRLIFPCQYHFYLAIFKVSGLESVMFLSLYIFFANAKYVTLISQLWCKICFLLSILLWKIRHSWFNSGTHSSGNQNSDVHRPLWRDRSFPTLYNLMLKSKFFSWFKLRNIQLEGMSVSHLLVNRFIYISVSQTSLSRWISWHSSCSNLY